MFYALWTASLALAIIATGCAVPTRPVRVETELAAGRQPRGNSGTPPVAPSSDCPLIPMDGLDDPSLTRAEKLARMDEALSQSFDRSEACRAKMRHAGAADTGRMTPEASAPLGGDPLQSVASSEIAGTETPPASVETSVATAVVGQKQRALPNGRPPEDIPDADNDSVLAAQIHKAAMQETDPEKRKRLWEEYRRYKDRAAAQEY